MGGATHLPDALFGRRAISIHAPRGGSDSPKSGAYIRRTISIHAPRGGSDGTDTALRLIPCYFNPRSPWGERLQNILQYVIFPYFNPRSPWGERQGHARASVSDFKISIHAPRGGSDKLYQTAMPDEFVFQSTLPVGGATLPLLKSLPTLCLISIHAPRGGSDPT